MGRKKRSKPNPEEAPPAIIAPIEPPPPNFAPPPPTTMMPPPPVMNPHLPTQPQLMHVYPPAAIKQESRVVKQESVSSIQIKSASIKKIPDVELDEADMGTKPSSMYGLHSHSGDLVEDDIYVSDGSIESDNDEEEDEQQEDADTKEDGGDKKETTKTKKEPPLELVLTTSKMGLMRRGGISSLLGQPVNRTWVRSEQTTENESSNSDGDPTIKKEEEEEETITDPTLLLQMQQRKIEQAKQNARILESSENAGRDPCLFSKRTAFDIRMDQIEDKPWEKPMGGADITDYMNYGLTEEDWMEYAERQLAVRQELTDAAKQKRLPDPGIVPVVPRAPTKQGDRVAVRVKKVDENVGDDTGAADAAESDSDDDDGVEMMVESGPAKDAAEDEKSPDGGEEASDGVKESDAKIKAQNGDGNATPAQAGAKEDSVLIRLIQEQSGQVPPPMMGAPGMMMGMPPPNMMPPPMMAPPPPPPPPKMMPQQNNQDRGPNNNNNNMRQEQQHPDGNWRRDMHHERPRDNGQWRRDNFNHNQQGPPPRSDHPNDRERYDGGRDRDNRGHQGHPDPHWDQHSQPPQQSPGNFRHQQPPFQQRRGPPPFGGPPGGRGGPDRFHHQHPPPHMMRPPMGRGRGDGWGPGRGGGPPPQWGDGRKRPRDFDPRGDPGRHGRW